MEILNDAFVTLLLLAGYYLALQEMSILITATILVYWCRASEQKLSKIYSWAETSEQPKNCLLIDAHNSQHWLEFYIKKNSRFNSIKYIVTKMYYSSFRCNLSRNHYFSNYSVCEWAKGWKSRYKRARARGALCWKINVRAEFISFFWPSEQPFLCISLTSGNHESLCRDETSLL